MDYEVILQFTFIFVYVIYIILRKYNYISTKDNSLQCSCHYPTLILEPVTEYKSRN